MSTTPSAFISGLYTNVLRRSVSAGTATNAELLSWDSLRTAGILTDAQVTSSIVSSVEATTFVAPIIRIYQTFFNRVPDSGGLDFWVARFRAGASLASISAGFATATEYTNAYGTPSASTIDSFLTALYTNVLGRTADVGGFNFWKAQFTAQGSTAAAAASIAASFASSVEFVNSSATNITALLTSVASSGSLGTGPLGGANGGATGTTFTFTTSSDNFTGTSANDTFNGTLDGTTGTYSAGDTVAGGTGTDTLNLVVQNTNATLPIANTTGIETLNVRTTGVNLTSGDLSALSGLTTFNADRSVGAGTITVTNLASGGSFGVIGDNSSTGTGTLSLGYASAATAAILNVSGGVKGGAAVTLTGTGVLATTINSSGLANTLGTITDAATSKAVTINATSNLTAKLTGTVIATLTTTGTGTIDLSGAALDNTVTTINASAMTAGGLKVVAGTSTTIKFTGGAGADSFTTGATAATGAAIDGGAGTDTLVVGASAHVAAAPAAFYKNFEALSIGAFTINLDDFSANNTFAALTVTGSATVTNINAATAAAVTMTASNTSTLGVKGALTPGQIDTLNIAVNDGAAAVNTITITAPTIAGVEVLGIAATDNATVTSLANALALTNINISGAAATSVTTTAIALQTNFNVNASSATGNVTFDATGATTNGFSFTGGAGINTVTGGSQVFSANLSASTAKADIIALTNATGGTLTNFNATITGFTNSATSTIGDKLDLVGGTPTFAAVTSTATGTTNLTASVSATGIVTFAGTAAATVSLTTKISELFTAAFLNNNAQRTVAFEHSGSTYILTEEGTAAGYVAGTDSIVQLTGVTGVTALSTTASGATTIWVI